MSLDIFSLKLGLTSCYLIRGKTSILIDAGMPNKIRSLKLFLKRLYIQPEEISMIILTHSHFDHVGSAEEIKKLTGAKILIHENERDFLSERKFAPVKSFTSWGNIALPLFLALFNKVPYPVVNPDIYMSGDEFPLYDYGIDGKLFLTPGHTRGSISLLLDTGEAFVGCLAHSGMPFRMEPGLPAFAYDMEMVKTSWKLLIKNGAKIIFPGHGKPFSVGIIKKLFET